MLGQIDHSLEQLLLVENSADTRDSSPEWKYERYVGAGYTFFWSGRKREEMLEAGVGQALSASSQAFQKALISL